MFSCLLCHVFHTLDNMQLTILPYKVKHCPQDPDGMALCNFGFGYFEGTPPSTSHFLVENELF